MPPQSKKSPTVGRDIETVEAAPPGGAPIQDPTPPITEHEPKVAVEESDLKDNPVKTSGAVPVSQVTADKIDEAATKDTVMIQHPVYGSISLVDLEEVLRAEIKSEKQREEADQEGGESEICGHCFPEGWDSKNATGQDGVGCEHGSYSRRKTKSQE